MNTYLVKYLNGTDMQVAYVQGGNETEAGKEFSKIYPNIKSDKILSITNIGVQQNSYGTSILIAKFISFIGWIAVVAGIALVLSGGFFIFGISSTISIISSGFMLILGGQITRAVVDNANYTKQILIGG